MTISFNPTFPSTISAAAITNPTSSKKVYTFFTYYYTNGSGDYYEGYVYAPTGLLSQGSFIYNQPNTAAFGGAALGSGYYYIYSVADGKDSSYDGQEYISSYYDGDTGKTSDTLHSSPGEKSALHGISVADRRTTAESGYVYDPSVPDSDIYLGNADVCYNFSISDNAKTNFLAAYVTGIRYWNQPEGYIWQWGCCQELAAIQMLSYWDNLDYANARLEPHHRIN